MRIVAWNCQDRFPAKIDFIRDLNFDVAVVSECGRLPEAHPEDRGLSCALVTPVEHGRKNLGVFAQEPWTVQALSEVADQPWLLPAAISGPTDFTLLAVWALDPKYCGGLSYAAQTARVVEEVLPRMVGPVVLAGDLNAPLASDRRSVAVHNANVEGLAVAGMVSAFTAARGSAVDPLTEPTLFHLRREDRPFHIDHVFLPSEWASGLTVSVGTFQDWVASGRSDHVPVIVDVTIPA